MSKRVLDQWNDFVKGKKGRRLLGEVAKACDDVMRTNRKKFSGLKLDGESISQFAPKPNDISYEIIINGERVLFSFVIDDSTSISWDFAKYLGLMGASIEVVNDNIEVKSWRMVETDPPCSLAVIVSYDPDGVLLDYDVGIMAPEQQLQDVNYEASYLDLNDTPVSKTIVPVLKNDESELPVNLFTFPKILTVDYLVNLIKAELRTFLENVRTQNQIN